MTGMATQLDAQPVGNGSWSMTPQATPPRQPMDAAGGFVALGGGGSWTTDARDVPASPPPVTAIPATTPPPPTSAPATFATEASGVCAPPTTLGDGLPPAEAAAPVVVASRS